MNPLEKFDDSWEPIIPLLHQDKLSDLKYNILPNISYQPATEDIFNVFRMPVSEIKVVILGQDPYPTPGDAIGYSFATREERRVPKSLNIIAQEIEKEGLRNLEADIKKPGYKTLSHWRDQGVFLLNTALTVETGKAGSHLKYWEDFTKRVLNFISIESPCIWILWGKKAQNYRNFIHNKFDVQGYDDETIKEIPAVSDYNYVLQAPHPAAELYSGGKAGFYGCNHFKYSNEILKKNTKKEIIW